MDWFTVGADSSSRRVVAVSEERTSDGMETIYTMEQRSSEHGAIMVSEVAEDTMKEEHGEMLEAYKPSSTIWRAGRKRVVESVSVITIPAGCETASCFSH